MCSHLWSLYKARICGEGIHLDTHRQFLSVPVIDISALGLEAKVLAHLFVGNGRPIFSLKELVFRCKFHSDIEIKVRHEGGSTRVEYHTPVGVVSTKTIYTDEMRKAGASITWVDERVIKRPEDYRVVGYIFENLELGPDFDDFTKWKKDVGEDGVAITPGCGLGTASPMHHIQKDLLDATDFYYHYHDYQKEMRVLAEIMENYYSQALKISADSPAEAVMWGGNFDDMITYPTYFEKEILPWVRKASDTLWARGKILICHCDGENLGLMDLLRDSGMHVAEAVSPYPMTKVKIEEYYQRWSDRVTIFGGIPESLLLEESTTEEDFEAYLNHLFKVVAPGKRLILGIGDTTLSCKAQDLAFVCFDDIKLIDPPIVSLCHFEWSGTIVSNSDRKTTGGIVDLVKTLAEVNSMKFCAVPRGPAKLYIHTYRSCTISRIGEVRGLGRNTKAPNATLPGTIRLGVIYLIDPPIV